MKQEFTRQIEKILYHVEKPGRYVGGEHNQVIKDWESTTARVALAFPDIYDLGQPNLGLAIIYDILNAQPGTLAERVFVPWGDMETQLRQHGIPLFSLESKQPLNKFDILGITLPYESIYTNVLNLLDLGGIPLLSTDRSSEHPLVIAGGQACFNPEPMANFIDAFVIGEGEEVILEIVHAWKAWKASAASRTDLLLSLAAIEGIYVPSLYGTVYNADNTLQAVTPLKTVVPAVVTKRMAAILPPPLTNFLVPNVEIVHDRISVEIMRGCTRGCRFCHAGTVNRPVRERKVEDVVEAIYKGLEKTGYESVGLLSLSSSDHTRILELIRAVYDRFHESKVAVSLPSLRIASFSVDLMDELKDLRPGGGFTIAPEAATDRMRAVINKPLEEEVLYDTVRMVFEHGWLSLKLYFMIGLPGETMEDVEAILEIGRKVLAIGRSIRGNRVKVHLGVATFIPKPHTPFQWYPVNTPEVIQQKLDVLKQGARQAKLKLSYNLPETTLLESWLSRGDRQIGRVILQAWKNGAKFDAWGELFNKQAWLDAFAQTGVDPDFYVYRERDTAELLPWDHISTGIHKDFLVRDLQLSKLGRTRRDCREGCYACGILDEFGGVRPEPELGYWGCP